MNPYMYQPPMGFPQPPMGFPQPPMGFPRQSSSSNILSGIIILAIICVIAWATVFRKDGKFSEWGNWGKCSKPCGGGTQTRTRKYIPPEFGGKDVDNKDDLTETKDCNTEACKIDGYMTEWEESSQCLKNRNSSANDIQVCGQGEKRFIRNYIPPQNGGNDVNSNDKNILEKWEACKIKDCPNQDEKMSDWIQDSNDNNCYKQTNEGKNLNPPKVTCGDGYKKETRFYIPKSGNGKSMTNLDDKNKIERYNTIKCELNPCPIPVDASCTSWEDADLLNQSNLRCNINVWEKKQTRKYNEPINGGKAVIGDCNINSKERWIKNSDGICPSEGTFISDFITKDEAKCLPNKGKNRFHTVNAEYTMAVGSGKNTQYINDNFSSKLNDIKQLQMNQQKTFKGDKEGIDIIFKRINNTKPEKYTLTKKYTCDNIPYHTVDEIKTYWKQETGCTIDIDDNLLKNLNTSLENLSYIEQISDVKNKFKSYNNESLKNTNDQNLINQCYGNDAFFVIKSNRNNNKLYKRTEINNRINDNATQDIIVLQNNGWKLIFQLDGNLVIRNKDNGEIWSTGSYHKGGTKLRMQDDGNLVIYTDVNVAIWNSDTRDVNYLELTDRGYLLLKKSHQEIIKVLHPRSSYIVESGKWRTINNDSRDNCKSNWIVLGKDGSYEFGPFSSVTRLNDNYPWCATNDESQGNKDKRVHTIVNMNGVNEIIHIVLLNYLGERIYIEPHIFQNIINDNDKSNDDNEDLCCNCQEYNAVNAYNIKNNRYEELERSSDHMTEIFKNEGGTRKPYRFNRDYGGWHQKKDMHSGCTQFWNLYGDDRLTVERTSLKNDGFKEFSGTKNDHINWLRNPRGSSEYSRYWRVFYRTINDYVDYLNKK